MTNAEKRAIARKKAADAAYKAALIEHDRRREELKLQLAEELRDCATAARRGLPAYLPLEARLVLGDTMALARLEPLKPKVSDYQPKLDPLTHNGLDLTDFSRS
jgi:hypothetical protein